MNRDGIEPQAPGLSVLWQRIRGREAMAKDLLCELRDLYAELTADGLLDAACALRAAAALIDTACAHLETAGKLALRDEGKQQCG
jgi:hypothetical protein